VYAKSEREVLGVCVRAIAAVGRSGAAGWLGVVTLVGAVHVGEGVEMGLQPGRVHECRHRG